MVLEAVSVAHSAVNVGSEARILERLCSAAAQSGAFREDFASSHHALTHHSNLRQAEEQLAPRAQQLRSRTPSVAAVSPRRHRSPHRCRSPDCDARPPRVRS